MTDTKSSESRRKLLKSIAAGSGAIVAGKSLPESWSRPVVDSVMLPAHAQTSAQIYASTAAENWGWCVTIMGTVADVVGIDGGYSISPGGTPKFRFAGQIPTSGIGTNAIQLVAQGSNCIPPGDPLLSRNAYLQNITASTATLFVEEGPEGGGYFSVDLTLVDSCPSWTIFNCTPG